MLVGVVDLHVGQFADLHVGQSGNWVWDGNGRVAPKHLAMAVIACFVCSLSLFF